MTGYSHNPSTPPPASPPGMRGPLSRRTNANPAHWSTTAIAEMSIAVALAAALGLLKLFVMPQGGSVSLEMLPILFIAVRRGLVPALTVGVVYGFVQLLLPGAFLVQPVQVLLDYPLAFGALCFAALVPVPVAPRGLAWREIRRSPGRVVPFVAALTGAVALACVGALRVSLPVGDHLLCHLRPRRSGRLALLPDVQPVVPGAGGAPHHRAAGRSCSSATTARTRLEVALRRHDLRHLPERRVRGRGVLPATVRGGARGRGGRRRPRASCAATTSGRSC